MNPASIQRDSILLYLSHGRLRTRRKMEAGAVDSDIDPALLHVSKDILESPELGVIQAHDNNTRTWVRARCLPSPFKGKGLMILPIALAEQVDTKLEEFKQQRQGLIEQFMVTYQQRKEEARPRLASGYDEDDYPSETKVRRSFTFEHIMTTMETPGKLQTFNRRLYQKELARMDNVWRQAADTITGALLDEFRKLTAHVSERLAAGEDGKGKIFRDTTITRLTDWLDLFTARNLTSDTELVEVVERARALVKGVDVDSVRDSATLRAQLATEFGSITQEIDKAIINRPTRAIEVEELGD